MAAPFTPNAARLIALAKPLRLNRIAEAEGRCFAVSLDLARRARERLGMDVALVTWRVRDDPSYADHWAVLLDAEHAIDPTRVQVDGLRQIVCHLEGYPANFDRLRIYPSSLLLPDYERLVVRPGARLPGRFMWRCGLALWRFDTDRARATCNSRSRFAAIRDFTRFLICFGMTEARRALNRRACALRERLRVDLA